MKVPFEYGALKGRRVQIFRGGRWVGIVAGRSAERLLARIADAGPRERQRVMARATGHRKQGIEGVARDKSRRP